MSVQEQMPATRRLGRVRLTDVDPDLGAPIYGVAGRVPTVAVIEIRAGHGQMALEEAIGHGSSHSALVLKGFLLRDIVAGGGSITELVGPGDVLTADAPDDDALLPVNVRWRSPDRTLIADLATVEPSDPAAQAGLVDAISRRWQAQADRASVRCAITSIIRVDLRLLAYLWHLAGSFGVVAPSGVRLDLPLTHAVLAQLIGARRPTVTTAFRTLQERGDLQRDGRSIVLSRERAAVPGLEPVA